MITFDTLNNMLGGTEKPENWKKHANGGGWKHISAHVDASAVLNGIIGKGATVGARATVGDWAKVGDWATVGEGAGPIIGHWERSPLYVIGSKYPVCNAKAGYAQIGCKTAPFKWWTSPAGELFAKDHGYNEAEIREYRAIIELMQKIGK